MRKKIKICSLWHCLFHLFVVNIFRQRKRENQFRSPLPMTGHWTLSIHKDISFISRVLPFSPSFLSLSLCHCLKSHFASPIDCSSQYFLHDWPAALSLEKQFSTWGANHHVLRITFQPITHDLICNIQCTMYISGFLKILLLLVTWLCDDDNDFFN